jgi:hypothetical protein
MSTGSSILHIESDVIISPDFPIEKFLELDRAFAYTIIGEGSGVASILWVRDSLSAQALKIYIDSSVACDPNMTDMKILGSFQKNHPDTVRVLSSFPRGVGKTFSPDERALEEDFAYTEELFGGYFDAADVGQYLLGDDPRNHRGFKYLRKELSTSYLKPSKLRYAYSLERKFIELPENSPREYYSLHIHSKNSRMFSFHSQERVLKKAILNQDRAERHVFVLSVFLSSVRASIRRRIRTFRELDWYGKS